ncbi:pre-mRNA processing RNA-helicase [Gaertneriomyces sp. JEL0708]|nr:pre-mRNA processing RNA-helicase [Gaertneriomyces sp. JEL0708]
MQSTGSSVTSAPAISIKVSTSFAAAVQDACINLLKDGSISQTPNMKTEDVETPAESKDTTETSAEEKLRLRRERMEQWRRERLVKGGTQDTVKAESSDSTEKRKSLSVDAQTDIRSPTVSMPSPIPSVKQEASLPVNMVTVKSQSKTGTKFGFGKPKLGISLKPAAKPIKTKFVQPKASVSFGFGDYDDDDSRMSALPTKKLRLLGPEDMDVDKSASAEAEDVEDTLEAFMTDVTTEVQKLQESDQLAQAAADGAQSVEEVAVNDDADSDEPEGPEDLIAAAAKKLAAKRKDLAQVDHSTLNYEPFRKDFYIEPPELADLTKEEVDIKRVELDGIKIRGARCPKPIEKWTQFGLPVGVQQVIGKVLKYDKPTPIQAQAIPAVMSGRDVIGIAKTGSGKTIAFLLPMFRHIKDQRPLEPQEGPIALIMTPTRELAVQIHKECKHFVRAMNLRTVCCYGGSPIKDNIAELKRGAEIIICTPGRMIDLLCANSGRVTNLRRVTYLVLDEADRMFDMGFEPQVMRIVNNVRPDRQTILFSATFPRKMEALARKILQKPLEITVGGRSVVASDVEQIVEVLQDDNAKFLRLLDILGRVMNEDPDAKVLIFTDRQDAADNLLTQLLRKGYPCQSIHGGKDQADRDSSISDFKSGDTNILIATSVAARGLDVKQLKVVVNYECPNHMEDYVHRVGRTGRAGNKGTAYTFITPDQDKYAVDIVKALKMSQVPIPEGLQQLADVFIQKVKSGTAQYSSSGFGGKGLEQLEKERDIVKKMQKIAHGAQYGEVEEEEDEEEVDVKFEAKAVPAGTAAKESTPVARAAAAGGAPGAAAAAVKAAQEAAAKVNAAVGTTGAQRARDIIAEINAKFKDAAAGGVGADDKKQASEAAYAYEIEINDYPQKARWRVTNKEQISQITEISGAAITTRGTFFPAGKQPGPGERKLYLFIEGDTQFVIDKAKAEIKRIITEATISSMESEAAGGGRYSVV